MQYGATLTTGYDHVTEFEPETRNGIENWNQPGVAYEGTGTDLEGLLLKLDSV